MCRIITCLVLVLTTAQLVLSAATTPFDDDAVCAAARSSLPQFLEKIPVGFEIRYGFRTREEFSNATIGTPLRLYIAKLDVEESEAADTPVALDEWRVPVLVNKEVRVLLTVSNVNGTPKGVGLGGAVLARECGEFDKKHPGRNRALFRIDALKCDFILHQRTGKRIHDGEYFPLRSARSVFGSDTMSFRTRKSLFSDLHQRQKKQLRNAQ